MHIFINPFNPISLEHAERPQGEELRKGFERNTANIWFRFHVGNSSKTIIMFICAFKLLEVTFLYYFDHTSLCRRMSVVMISALGALVLNPFSFMTVELVHLNE